jgi:hypothetical protein
MRLSHFILLITALLSANPIQAQTLEQQRKALAIIRETAADICGGPVPLEQSNQQIDLTGSAKAKLDGAVGKLVAAGISGAAKYKSGSSKGVLQSDLASAIKSGSDCRRSVFQTLVPRMVVPAKIGTNGTPDTKPVDHKDLAGRLHRLAFFNSTQCSEVNRQLVYIVGSQASIEQAQDIRARANLEATIIQFDQVEQQARSLRCLN